MSSTQKQVRRWILRPFKGIVRIFATIHIAYGTFMHMCECIVGFIQLQALHPHALTKRQILLQVGWLVAVGWILVAGRRTVCVALSRAISVLALVTLHQHLRVSVCVRERGGELGLRAEQHAAIGVFDAVVNKCVPQSVRN